MRASPLVASAPVDSARLTDLARLAEFNRETGAAVALAQFQGFTGGMDAETFVFGLLAEPP